MLKHIDQKWNICLKCDRDNLCKRLHNSFLEYLFAVGVSFYPMKRLKNKLTLTPRILNSLSDRLSFEAVDSKVFALAMTLT